jgi:integrase
VIAVLQRRISLDLGRRKWRPPLSADRPPRQLVAATYGRSVRLAFSLEILDYSRLHLVPHVGTKRIQRLRATDLQSLYATLQREKGLAARTVLHVHRAAHRMLRHAAQWGVVHQNAAALVDAPSVQDAEIDTLTPGEVQAVLRTLKGRPIYALAAVALGTGMRRGEMLALRWQDVDMNGAALRVERSLEQTTKHGLVFKAPKTKYGRRTITLPPSTVTELRTHWKAQQEFRLATGQGRANDDALVFGDMTDRRARRMP